MDTAKDVNWCLVLKEYADANKCTLQYYEMSESGKPNIPTFDVKVRIAGDDKREGAGRGTTKKAAKAQAAQALMVLVDRDNGHPESHIPVNAYRIRAEMTMISRMMLRISLENYRWAELCQKNKWPLPSYTQRTVGHSYTCSCNVTAPGDEYEVVYVYAKGSGPSKRIARREAAKRALRFAELLSEFEEKQRGPRHGRCLGSHPCSPQPL
ncbi:hypothetical protein KUCAC02_033074 [Chaenocephalus aceratus]|nr:hypothetical protein KUCAC02_033074 [Chaenocephalus aceratus]